jgi:hypothetical protein
VREGREKRRKEKKRKEGREGRREKGRKKRRKEGLCTYAQASMFRTMESSLAGQTPADLPSAKEPPPIGWFFLTFIVTL